MVFINQGYLIQNPLGWPGGVGLKRAHLKVSSSISQCQFRRASSYI